MRKVSFILATFISILFASCKKEEVVQPTQAEVISAQLQELVRTEKVDRVVCFQGSSSFANTSFGSYGTNYKFEKSFVTVEGQSWNLLYLKKYEIRVQDNIKYLGLYF
jgi:hypothetical protein